MGELFKSVTGAPIAHVPYKGSGPAVIDLVGGQIQVPFDGLPSLLGQINAGKPRWREERWYTLLPTYASARSIFDSR